MGTLKVLKFVALVFVFSFLLSVLSSSLSSFFLFFLSVGPFVSPSLLFLHFYFSVSPGCFFVCPWFLVSFSSSMTSFSSFTVLLLPCISLLSSSYFLHVYLFLLCVVFVLVVVVGRLSSPFGHSGHCSAITAASAVPRPLFGRSSVSISCRGHLRPLMPSLSSRLRSATTTALRSLSGLSSVSVGVRLSSSSFDRAFGPSSRPSRPLFDNRCGRALSASPAFSIIVSAAVRLPLLRTPSPSLSVPVRLSPPLCLRLRCYLCTAIVRCCCFLAARPSPCPACPSVPVILSLSVRSSVVWYLSIRPVWLSVRPDHHFLSSPSIISIWLFRVFLCPLSSSHGLVRLPLVVVRPLLRLVSSSHRQCSTSPFGGSSIWLHRLSVSCRSSHCPAYLPAPSSSPIVSNAIFIGSFVWPS